MVVALFSSLWMLMLCFLFQVHGNNLNGHSTSRQSNNTAATDERSSTTTTTRLMFEIKVHGILLWLSFGFLVPIGIILIRISQKHHNYSTKRTTFFLYLHALFQILSVLLVTIGAVMSLKNFDNTFTNAHQRLGLALYFLAWIQLLIGIFRSPRGSKRRSIWYFVHWLLGIAVSLLGIINIYTGLQAYHRKMSRSPRVWMSIFTAELILIFLVYLFQEKWEYIQKQGQGGVLLRRGESVQPTDQENNIKHSSFQPTTI